MSCPRLAFTHLSNYFSLDVSLTGASVTVNEPVSIKVTLHNLPGTDGLGQVAVYWCEFATSIIGTPTPIVPVLGTGDSNYNPTLPAEIASNGSHQFTIDWVPGPDVNGSSPNPTQVGIFAQAIATPCLAPDGSVLCGGWSYPNDFNPAHYFNALQVFGFIADNTSVLASPGRRVLKTRASGSDPAIVAFGIANRHEGFTPSRVAARALWPDSPAREDAKLIAEVRQSRLIADLLEKGGRWRNPSGVAVAQGREAVIHRPDRATKMPRLGYTGAVSAELAERLRSTTYASTLEVDQIAGELRQGLLRVTPATDAEAGDFYVVDVRHERRDAPASSDEAVGGCLMVVESGRRA